MLSGSVVLVYKATRPGDDLPALLCLTRDPQRWRLKSVRILGREGSRDEEGRKCDGSWQENRRLAGGDLLGLERSVLRFGCQEVIRANL